MKNILNSLVIVLLFLVTGNTNAQVVVTKNGMQTITEQPVNLVLKDYKGDIQWQRSADSTVWEDISGATNDTIEVTVDETWCYRAKVTVGTCDPFYSDLTTILHDFETGDTTYIAFSTTMVGPEDNSAGWWAYFSDYFNIPVDMLLHLEFINYGTGVNNWNNWNLAIANAERGADGYSEYFVFRADAYGWGNADFSLSMISHDYRDMDGDADIWDDFRTTMQGAYVTLEIDHAALGYAYVTATAVGTNDTVLVETYNQPVSAVEDLVAFLICDGSHFEMKKAYLIPSKKTVVEDFEPDTIIVTGAPSSVEIGNENYWGDAIATVTFTDGYSTAVDSADLSFTVTPDMTTIGEKTVTVSYNKTKLGENTEAVTTEYTLEVTNPITGIEVTTLPDITTYYFYNSDSIFFDPTGIVVTATYSDASTAVMDNDLLVFNKIEAVEGAQDVAISFKGTTGTVTTTCPLTLVKGTSQVGNTDYSSVWWTAFSDDAAVASGNSVTFTMYCYSLEANNWQSPCTILRKADLNEYAVVRMDNFGWGSGYGTATLSNNWDWDKFTSSISASKIVITVTNNGDNTADVLYNVTYANGETHFQQYAGITVESADLNCALVTEASYLVLIENEDSDADTIIVAGAPSSVEIGNENFWGNATATVTFKDATFAKIDSVDLSFTVTPDMTTVGEKTVTVSYSKTKFGEACSPVETSYTLEVTNPITGIEVTTLPKISTYYFFNSDSILFDTTGMVVTATYSDASTAIIDNDLLDFSKIEAVEGAQDFDITYVGATGTVTTTCPLTLVKGINQVGNTDYSSVWWTAFTSDSTVASGDSVTFTMYCYSDNLANWHSPCTILRTAALSENAVVRMDNFGWGTGYSTATLSSDWNWSIFTSNISGSKITITVKNNGDNTADVLYNVTYATGETHFQKYAGITVDSADLTCALVTEVSYLVMIDNE